MLNVNKFTGNQFADDVVISHNLGKIFYFNFTF